jgi:hypothetical protein
MARPSTAPVYFAKSVRHAIQNATSKSQNTSVVITLNAP